MRSLRTGSGGASVGRGSSSGVPGGEGDDTRGLLLDTTVCVNGKLKKRKREETGIELGKIKRGLLAHCRQPDWKPRVCF